MAQGLAEPDAAVRQGDVPDRGSARASAPDPSLHRGGRVSGWTRRAVGRGRLLPYTTYDRLGEIDQAAIVENKRLGHVLAIAAQVQALRDSRHQAVPSRTLLGEPPRPAKVPLNVKRQRLINRLDLERALVAAPLNPRAAAILTLPAARQPPHPAPSSGTSGGQRHRPTNKAKKEHAPAQNGSTVYTYRYEAINPHRSPRKRTTNVAAG